MYTPITHNNQSEQIKTILFPYIETIKKSIQHSSLLYWEEKIQFIFTNLNHIDFEWNSMIATWFGHAIRSIVSLSEIWLSLWWSVEWIQHWIQTLVFTMAMTCMKDFAQVSTALKISQTLDQSNEHATPIRKIPYQKEHFALEEGKLIIVDDTTNTLLSPVTWKCPAVWVVHSKNGNWLIEKKQIITFLLEEIAHSYIFTTTNIANMMQQG
jgi:hypothetical protein